MCKDYPPSKCYYSSVTIEITPPLAADFEFDCSGLRTVAFNATASGNPPFTYTWNFGDGNTSSLEDPTHTYAVNGIYTVQLTVKDVANGVTRTITVSHDVDINACCQFSVFCGNSPTGTYSCTNPIPPAITDLNTFKTTFSAIIGDNPSHVKISHTDGSFNPCSSTSFTRTYTIYQDMNNNDMWDAGEEKVDCQKVYQYSPDTEKLQQLFVRQI